MNFGRDSLESMFTAEERWELKRTSAETLIDRAQQLEDAIDLAALGLPLGRAELDDRELVELGVGEDDLAAAARVWAELHHANAAFLRHHINVLLALMPYTERAEEVYRALGPALEIMRESQRMAFHQLVLAAEHAEQRRDDSAWDEALNVAHQHVSGCESAQEDVLRALASLAELRAEGRDQFGAGEQ